jgi:hypothetical protein
MYIKDTAGRKPMFRQIPSAVQYVLVAAMRQLRKLPSYEMFF